MKITDLHGHETSVDNFTASLHRAELDEYSIAEMQAFRKGVGVALHAMGVDEFVRGDVCECMEETFIADCVSRNTPEGDLSKLHTVSLSERNIGELQVLLLLQIDRLKKELEQLEQEPVTSVYDYQELHNGKSDRLEMLQSIENKLEAVLDEI